MVGGHRDARSHRAVDLSGTGIRRRTVGVVSRSARTGVFRDDSS